MHSIASSAHIFFFSRNGAIAAVSDTYTWLCFVSFPSLLRFARTLLARALIPALLKVKGPPRRLPIRHWVLFQLYLSAVHHEVLVHGYYFTVATLKPISTVVIPVSSGVQVQIAALNVKGPECLSKHRERCLQPDTFFIGSVVLKRVRFGIITAAIALRNLGGTFYSNAVINIITLPATGQRVVVAAVATLPPGYKT